MDSLNIIHVEYYCLDYQTIKSSDTHLSLESLRVLCGCWHIITVTKQELELMGMAHDERGIFSNASNYSELAYCQVSRSGFDIAKVIQYQAQK